MDLSFDSELENFRRDVRDFLAQYWPAEIPEGELAAEREKRFRDLATLHGYLNRGVPRCYGGSEQPVDATRAEIIRQEFTRVRAPMEVRLGAGATLLVPTLLEWGSDWQKEMFIAPILRGDAIWCQGYSEPGAGSDLASVRTRAERIGGEWVITGQKIWTSYAYASDYIFILARTEPQAPKHDGISYLLVDMRQPGITVRPLKQLSGKADFCEVFFDEARTPAEWIVGARGQGWKVARTTLRHERSSIRGLNFQEARFRDLVRLARTSSRGGRPAIEDPQVRQRLVEIEGSIASMRYSAYRQFSMEVAGDDPGLFPMLRKLLSSNIAADTVRAARDLLDDDFLLHSNPDNPATSDQSRWIQTYFSSFVMAIAGGTSNIQRNIIAERGLGLPRDRADA